jgi:hypothetical protein
MVKLKDKLNYAICLCVIIKSRCPSAVVDDSEWTNQLHYLQIEKKINRQAASGRIGVTWHLPLGVGATRQCSTFWGLQRNLWPGPLATAVWTLDWDWEFGIWMSALLSKQCRATACVADLRERMVLSWALTGKISVFTLSVCRL